MALEQIEEYGRMGALAGVLSGSAFGRRFALDGWLGYAGKIMI